MAVSLLRIIRVKVKDNCRKTWTDRTTEQNARYKIIVIRCEEYSVISHRLFVFTHEHGKHAKLTKMFIWACNSFAVTDKT